MNRIKRIRRRNLDKACNKERVLECLMEFPFSSSIPSGSEQKEEQPKL